MSKIRVFSLKNKVVYGKGKRLPVMHIMGALYTNVIRKEDRLNLVKIVLKKIGIGFLYGVGFVLGAWALGYFVNGAPYGSDSEPKESVIEESRVNRSLSITSSRVMVKPDIAEFSGEVFNNEYNPINQASIELYLLNKEHAMLHKCSFLLDQSLLPKAKTTFSFSCAVPASAHQNFGSHKAYITN